MFRQTIHGDSKPQEERGAWITVITFNINYKRPQSGIWSQTRAVKIEIGWNVQLSSKNGDICRIETI